MDLRTSVEHVGSLPVLVLSGAVDLATVPRLQDELLRLTTDHDGRRVAVDVDGVEVLDDVALGVLLGAAGRARRSGGDLVVVCAGARLRRRFELTGLDRAIDVVGAAADVVAGW